MPSIKVKNLEESSNFYTEKLGLTHGLLDEKRRWHFLWLNERAGMIVLQEDNDNWQEQHFAFSVACSELGQIKSELESLEILVRGPVKLGWMSAQSLYFKDPNGHSLKFTAIQAVDR